jgi:hypothetical protein
VALRLPDDPFGGSAGVKLRYRRKALGKGYALYSVDQDTRDDGGRPSVRANPFIPGSVGQQGDLVLEN